VGLKLIAAPTTLPLSLTEVKSHLREESTDQDALITIFLKAATQNVDGPDGFLGRALIDQTWDLLLDGFPTSGPIKVPLPPLLQVIGVFYRDAAGVEQEFSAASYVVADLGDAAVISLGVSKSWPTTLVAANAVRVRFRAGYVDNGASPPAGEVLFDIKAAILLTVGTLYANRETVVVGQSAVQIPWGAEQLLRPHRVQRGMA
jgi:uncharacterized phiE125 gp8 family phage protein